MPFDPGPPEPNHEKGPDFGMGFVMKPSVFFVLLAVIFAVLYAAYRHT